MSGNQRMFKKQTFLTLAHLASIALVAALLTAMTSTAHAQRGGPRSWMTNTRLIQLERIQEELELSEDQVEELQNLDKRDDDSEKKEEGETKEERPNWREMSDEQRSEYLKKRREATANRQSAAEEKLAEVLLPHQVRRLEQVKIQILGASALEDEKVIEELKLTDETREKMKTAVTERREEMKELMRDAFMSGDRDAIQETMAEMRASMEEAVMEALSDEQTAKLKELKGPPLSFTPEQLMGDFFKGMGGRGGDRDRGRGGDRGRRDSRDRDDK